MTHKEADTTLESIVRETQKMGTENGGGTWSPFVHQLARIVEDTRRLARGADAEQPEARESRTPRFVEAWSRTPSDQAEARLRKVTAERDALKDAHARTTRGLLEAEERWRIWKRTAESRLADISTIHRDLRECMAMIDRLRAERDAAVKERDLAQVAALEGAERAHAERSRDAGQAPPRVRHDGPLHTTRVRP